MWVGFGAVFFGFIFELIHRKRWFLVCGAGAGFLCLVLADQMPVVTLSSETKQTMNYGDVEAPVLTVVDWQPFGDGAAPPGMRNLPPPAWPPVQQVLPPKASLSQDMSEIQF